MRSRAPNAWKATTSTTTKKVVVYNIADTMANGASSSKAVAVPNPTSATVAVFRRAGNTELSFFCRRTLFVKVQGFIDARVEEHGQKQYGCTHGIGSVMIIIATAAFFGLFVVGFEAMVVPDYAYPFIIA